MQVLKQLERGDVVERAIEDETFDLERLRKSLDSKPPSERPLMIHAMLFSDEHHRKTIFGDASKMEVQVCRHPVTGIVCSEEDGGEYPAQKPTMTVKYSKEGRVSAAVYIKKNGTSYYGDKLQNQNATIHEQYSKNCTGDRAPLYFYSGKKVVTP